MCLVNQNLTTRVYVKVRGKVREKSPYKVRVKVHVLTKLTKSPNQYLQKSLSQVGVLDKEKLKLEYN